MLVNNQFNIKKTYSLLGDYMKIYKHKKNKLYVFILFVFMIILGGIYNIKATSLPLLGHTFYLDPGHGGVDPGSLYKDIYEKDINLAICIKIKDKLEQLGAIVYMTRCGDYDLSYINSSSRKKSDLNNRAKIINESNADMYISIHLNSVTSTTWHGAQVFYDDVNDENIKIASLFQKKFQKNLGTDREIKEISTMLLNRKVNIPGVLIEVGFLSNTNERYLLRQESYQDKIATNISEVLVENYN